MIGEQIETTSSTPLYLSYVYRDRIQSFTGNGVVTGTSVRVRNKSPYRVRDIKSMRLAGLKLRPLPYYMKKVTIKNVQQCDLEQLFAGSSSFFLGSVIFAGTEDPFGYADLVFGKADNSHIANEARSRYFNSLSQVKFDGMTFLAEGHQTVNMFNKLSNEIFGRVQTHESKVFNSIIKPHAKRGGKWSQIANIVSARWLEFSFGISPLVSDMKSLGEAIAQTNISPTFNSKVKGKDKLIQRTVTREVFSPPYFGACGHTTCSITRTLRVAFGSTYIRDDQGSFLEKNFGLSSSDVLPGLWEAIPYSFLVDYFTNAGKVINALSHMTDLKYTSNVWGTSSIEVELIWNSAPEDGFPSSQYKYPRTGCTAAKTKGFEFRRTVDPNVIPLPEFTFDLSKLQVGNLLALGTQLLTKKSERSTLLSSFVR